MSDRFLSISCTLQFIHGIRDVNKNVPVTFNTSYFHNFFNLLVLIFDVRNIEKPVHNILSLLPGLGKITYFSFS